MPLEVLHPARNWSKADVFRGEWPPGSGRRVVVKDLRGRPLWFRLLYGRAVLNREWKALSALHGVPGVPEVIARPDADVIVIEFRSGMPAVEFSDGALPAEVVGRIEQAVRELHARGVTHGDLHRKNILVADDGTITLIDWATASFFGPRPRGAKAVSFAEWCALDDRAVAKVKARHAPELMTPREREIMLQGGSPLYRAVKQVRYVGERLRRRHRKGAGATAGAAYQKTLEKDS